MKRSSILLYGLLILALISCGGEQGSDKGENQTDESTAKKVSAIDREEVKKLTNEIIDAVPKTEMISKVIEELQVDYDMHLLNPIENAGKYQLLANKAFNLGVYLSDLGYISSFDQKQEIIIYVNSAARKLSEGIGVNDVIDAETIENLELNMDNQDSLLTIIRRIYEETHEYLVETERLSTSAILVTGGWLEGIHLALQMRDPENPNALLDANIQKQWEVYGKVLALLALFPNDEFAQKMVESLPGEVGEPGRIIGVETSYEKVTSGIASLRNGLIEP